MISRLDLEAWLGRGVFRYQIEGGAAIFFFGGGERRSRVTRKR